MAKTLVIVESPAKAKTIEKYLGKDYQVESSIGHIRDLPNSASEVPEQYKQKPWASLGIDVEHDFRPLYVVPSKKKPHVAKLKALVKEAREVVLATDDDREGESIAWHLYQELKPKVPVKRMVFHEITPEAIRSAIQNPRQIDENLVHAQEARRVLDRLYGYEVSPVLWRKVAPKLSAGRVQSVATRLLVERERERMRFKSAEFWSLEGLFNTVKEERFTANLIELGGVRLASGKDFDPLTGQLKPDSKVVLLQKADAETLLVRLKEAPFSVISTEERPFTQKPYAPFITSSLQQEGSRKLGFSAQRTMRIAQKLYEQGYITYMRTDSTTLSKEAMEAARKQVRQMYGEEYLHPSPRTYDKKAKNAQEAHEAIRPAGSKFRTPQEVRGELSDEEFKLYDLIWKRTVASQMADARGRRMQVRLQGLDAVFSASGKTIDFPGFLRAYVEGSDDPEAALEDRELILPPMQKGDDVRARDLRTREHHTQPPARYTEASLVQALEAAGIGRPSTYASIISTIQDRGYVFKRGTALIPTWTAFATQALLENHFSKLVDYNFTARMEEDLDEIAGGRMEHVPYLQAFYFGDEGLKSQIKTQLDQIDPRAISLIPVPALKGAEIEVRLGKFGAYMKKGEVSATLPNDIAPDELTLEQAEELLSKGGDDGILGQDPETGQDVVAKAGRYGPYIQMGEKTASLFPTDSLSAMTLERALQLLTIPRLVGELDNEEVWAMNGRYGPYLKKGKDNRTLASHDMLFTVTVEEAKALFAAPRGRMGQAAAPLKVFEYADRTPILVKVGRFGPYLTDGDNNAYLRTGEDAHALTSEKARELMAERGKPPKARAGKVKKAASGKSSKTVSKASSKTKATSKTASKTPVKTASKAKTPAKTASKPAESKEKADWKDLKSHLDVLNDTERKLIVALREDNRKAEDVAPELGLEVKKAKGMYLQISKKLQEAWRKTVTA